MAEKSLFWADQLAERIVTRKKFSYLDKMMPSFDEYVVKTSASLSGVLHIGRLSDTIRGETVHRALKDAGHKARLIWVAEDMDPLRKVPKGVPSDYEKYIGMPVTDIPDPHGCHSSYAEHHVSEYFKVIDEFVDTKMEKFSMREEYRKGHFKEHIRLILENIDKVKEIQNRFRSNPLPEGWSPWKPICESCGKIITTHVTGFNEGLVEYECRDYDFEKTRANGCGHKGQDDPMRFNGKMMWKSEWAAQWARWKVVSEGAGKEYQVPNSAWWVNAEITEKVLDHPAPEPIFYEHIMIDGKKMSASLGNVVYPKDWLECAPPELLRFFYNKKLMKTRSFSWKDLPILYDDYDHHASVYFGDSGTGNEKERLHMNRLFEVSQKGEPRKPDMPFGQAIMLSQLPGNDRKKDERIGYASRWVENHSPESAIRLQESPSREGLTKEQAAALKELSSSLEDARSEDDVKNLCFEISKKHGLKPAEFFRACYKALIGKERGPRLAPFIIAVGQKKVADILGRL